MHEDNIWKHDALVQKIKRAPLYNAKRIVRGRYRPARARGAALKSRKSLKLYSLPSKAFLYSLKL